MPFDSHQVFAAIAGDCIIFSNINNIDYCSTLNSVCWFNIKNLFLCRLQGVQPQQNTEFGQFRPGSRTPVLKELSFLQAYCYQWIRHFSDSKLLEPDPEIDRIFRHLLKGKRDREKAMEDQNERKVLRDYVVPSLTGANSCIITLTIQANNFELKLGLIQIVQHTCQFGGFPYDDPNEHISSFQEICDKGLMVCLRR